MNSESSDGSQALPYIRDIIAAIHAQRSTIVISLMAFYVLAFPSVTREMYRILAEDIGIHWHQALFAFVTLFLTSAAILYEGNDLIWRLHTEDVQNPGPKRLLLRGLPIAGCALVPLGSAWGLLQASREGSRLLQGTIELPTPADLPPLSDLYIPSEMMSQTRDALSALAAPIADVSRNLQIGAAFCACLSLAIVVANFRTRPNVAALGRSYHGSKYTNTPLRNSLLLLSLVIVAAFCIFPVGLSRLIGTVGIFNLFTIVLVLLVGHLVYIHDRFGIPIVATSITLAVIFSILDLNDNHVVQPIKSKNGLNQNSAVTEFKNWYYSRVDRAAYRNRPYPVFIVSAAGGGLYAAQFTARFLARVQDHCPHFAQHVFAISGVSGGSVGAAVFSSIVRQEVRQTEQPNCRAFGKVPGPFERRATAILNKDYLAPIVGSALFPDFLQRFLPHPIKPFDRGTVLDRALETAWKEAYSSDKADNPFEMPLRDLWDSKGAAPALLLNSTQVGNGHRMVMAPFDPVPNRNDNNLIKLNWLERHIQGAGDDRSSEDLKLSTSVGISARFPWILPAATVHMRTATSDMESGQPKKQSDKRTTITRLVDGGYFENSGAETARDLILALDLGREGSLAKEVKIHLIVLSGYDGVFAGSDFDEPRSLPDPLSPVRALLSTRAARGDLAILRTHDSLCPDDGCPLPDKGRLYTDAWAFATLNLKDYRLPLSWQLSHFSTKIIGFHAGNPSECGNPKHAIAPYWTVFPRRGWRILGALHASSCASSVICARLANRELPFSENSDPQDYCSTWTGVTSPIPSPGR